MLIFKSLTSPNTRFPDEPKKNALLTAKLRGGEARSVATCSAIGADDGGLAPVLVGIFFAAFIRTLRNSFVCFCGVAILVGAPRARSLLGFCLCSKKVAQEPVGRFEIFFARILFSPARAAITIRRYYMQPQRRSSVATSRLLNGYKLVKRALNALVLMNAATLFHAFDLLGLIQAPQKCLVVLLGTRELEL